MELQLRRIRKAKSLSQQQLADSLGVDVKTIGNWERGATLMSIDQVWSCAEILESTPNDICGWYLEHPAESPSSPPLDPHERALLDCYEVLNGDGRSNLLATARGLSGLPEFCAGEQRDPLPAQGAA